MAKRNTFIPFGAFITANALIEWISIRPGLLLRTFVERKIRINTPNALSNLIRECMQQCFEAGSCRCSLFRHKQNKQLHQSRYDKPPFAARCCHVANDSANFIGDRQTVEL